MESIDQRTEEPRRSTANHLALRHTQAKPRVEASRVELQPVAGPLRGSLVARFRLSWGVLSPSRIDAIHPFAMDHGWAWMLLGCHSGAPSSFISLTGAHDASDTTAISLREG